MPTVKTVFSDRKVKVAVVFEVQGGMRPAWFEVLGEERVQVKEITARWTCTRGSAPIITFELWGGEAKHSLEYNAVELTWRAGETVFE